MWHELPNKEAAPRHSIAGADAFDLALRTVY
jgi:hypothetical protein